MWFDSCSKLFAHGLMTHVICNAEYFCGNRGELLTLTYSSVFRSLPPLCLSLSASSVFPSLPSLPPVFPSLPPLSFPLYPLCLLSFPLCLCLLCLALSASSLSFPLCLLSFPLCLLCLSPSASSLSFPLCLSLSASSLPFPLCLLSVFPSQPPCLDVDMPMLNPVKAWTDYHYIITVLETAEPCQGKNRLCNSNAWDKMNATSIVYCIFCVLHFLIHMNRWRMIVLETKWMQRPLCIVSLCLVVVVFLPSSAAQEEKEIIMPAQLGISNIRMYQCVLWDWLTFEILHGFWLLSHGFRLQQNVYHRLPVLVLILIWPVKLTGC